jgi:adenylate cyclase class 2
MLLNELEVEVKFWVFDAAQLRNRIRSVGAPGREPVAETNIRFENAGENLLRRRCLLRLRKGFEVSLTFKSPPEHDLPDFKVHRELEVVVGDFNLMQRILEAIGFHPAQTYEKIRQVFSFGDVQLCLDRLPFGDFLEIEGEPAAIRRMAERLGLRWEQRIVMNYLQMFEIIKTSLGLAFSDITFENFKGVSCPPEILASFHAT